MSSSLRRSREMWFHFVFKIQCLGKGCICRGVFDSMALRRYHCWVKSCFCSWWKFLMASKHAGLIFLLWLKHLVRIIDWSKEEKVDRPPLSLRSKSTLSVLLRPCSKTIHLAFLQFLFFSLRFMWARRRALSCSCLLMCFHHFLCWWLSRNQHFHQASAIL